MTSLDFDNKVLIEQVRGIESPEALTSNSIGSSPGQDFDGRLLQRAQHLVQQYSLQGVMSHAAKIWAYSNLLATLLAAVIGALAALSAMSGGSTLNIYWLLLVLVGFNILSMALWLVGVSIGTENLTSGVLSKASAWLPTLFGKADNQKRKADHAWLECHFSGPVGKWRLSKITQKLWLVYLCAGLTVLVIVLSTRQFDFVWGTTLLSDDTFVQLTSVLSQPLHVLGFATPTTQQVIETRIGAGYALNAEHRYSWAQFLIGALLVFGILPRLVLWFISRTLLGAAKRNFVLDNYLPYYIHLRQELMPIHGRSEIVDADSAAPQVLTGAGASAHERTYVGEVPATAQWAAVELSSTVHWPLGQTDPHNDLGRVDDRASLDAIIARLEANKPGELALVVMASRPPDRGLKRTILSLSDSVEAIWLVLVYKEGETPIADHRLAAWYRLAQECNVPAENVISRAES